MITDDRFYAGIKLDSLVKQRLGEVFTAEEYQSMLEEVCRESPRLFEVYQGAPLPEEDNPPVAGTRIDASPVGGGFEGVEKLLADILDNYFDSRLKRR